MRDLSGGERRRLQLMRLLMDEPNVLLLDEPTNDLDIDTLTALEDLLDGWPGTLVVVSHDRYFVERVCDDVYALIGDGAIRHLPGGIDAVPRAAPRRGRGAARPPSAPPRRAAPRAPWCARRARRLARLERDAREARRRARPSCTSRWPPPPRTFGRLRGLQRRARRADRRARALEAAWLETSEVLE